MTSSRYSSRFGDTALTKVFVGGLAWETPNEELRRHFEQYGEILEAVIITDKATGRSKGYGFVTFREPESARLACVESNPFIDGRRANCNIASQGLSLASRGRVHGHGSNYQGGRQYQRIQPPPPPPAPMYSPYGYMTYMGDYGYQQAALYNHPRLASQYQHHMYGPTSPSRMGLSYPYGLNWYTMQTSPTARFPLVQHIPPMQGPVPPPPPPLPPSYVQYPDGESSRDASFIPSSSTSSSSNRQVFRLQDPPSKRHAQQESQQTTTTWQQKPTSGGDSGKSSEGN